MPAEALFLVLAVAEDDVVWASATSTMYMASVVGPVALSAAL
jgi:hypothetical protein